MRAKEFIEQNQSSIKYLDDIKRVINELMPLRKNKEATDEYFNQILSADIRRQNYLLQKDCFERNNAMQLQKPTLESFANEIPFETASEFRDVLFQVIREDESFGYLFFLLGTEQNSKHKSDPIDCIPNSQNIKNALNRYRDDYPQKTLADYLNDDLNYLQYSKVTENEIIDETALLEHFNNTYRIYDEIRCRKGNPLYIARYFENDKSHQSEQLKYYAYSFIDTLITEFEQDDRQLVRCQKELDKVLEPLREKYEHKQEEILLSNIRLNSKKGFKVNYIRVINVLCEMGFFQNTDNTQIAKKEVFNAFGKFLNIDLSSYQNDLGATKSASNRDMQSLIKIFQDMLEKQQELINK